MRLQLNGFSAWITIDDVEQSNHSIEYSSDGSMNFSVYWKDLQRTFASTGRLFVDGMGRHGKLMSRGALQNTAFRDGFRTSANTKRLFLFSELELTDDDQYLHTATTDLGTIKLDIWRCEDITISKKLSNRVHTYSVPEKIHERSKKGLSHRCKLGPDVPSVGERVYRVKDLCKVVTFKFKYRPLVYLQANGIISLNQNPDCAGEINQDNKDDEALEAQRIRALRAELQQLEERQRERQKRVKAEPQVDVVKIETKGNDNFIDLT